MEGLLTQRAQPQEPQQNGALENMPPEHIQKFKEGYQLSRQFLYQEPIFDGLVADIEQGNPVNAITGAVVAVMLRVQEEVGHLPLSVAAALGISLFDDISESLEQTQIVRNSEQLQQELLSQGIILWLQSNKYPDQEVAAELQEIGAPPEMIQQILQQAGQQEEVIQQPVQDQPHPSAGVAQQGVVSGQRVPNQKEPRGLLRGA